MKTNYIFIDYENVQPEKLIPLAEHALEIYVLLGANQVKIPTSLVLSLQPLGERVTYITLSGMGPNALDFHIAFYLGRAVEKDPEGFFHIIAKDKGYDPLVEHLRAQKMKAYRHEDLDSLPMIRSKAAVSCGKPQTTPKLNGIRPQEKPSAIASHLDKVVKNLAGRGSSVPKKSSALFNTVQAVLGGESAKSEAKRVMQSMEARGYISILDDEKVAYNLPRELTT